MVLNRIHHVAIICSDYARSEKFYTEILGLPVVAETFREKPRSPKRTNSFIAAVRPNGYDSHMTAVAEIESAIEKLSPGEVKELAAWLDEYQQMVNASGEIFSIYDEDEGVKS